MEFKELDAMFEGALKRLDAGSPASPYSEPPAASVSCIHVDGRAHRIALRVGEANVAGRRKRDVQLAVGVDGDVLKRMPVPAQARRQIVGKIAHDLLRWPHR